MKGPNPHMKRMQPEELSPDMAAARERSIQLRGEATFFEVMGHNPDLYHWYIDRFYKELFYAERLDPKIKELLRLKLSSLHGCKFCNQGNRVDALAAGITQAQIDSVSDYMQGPFSNRERAVLRLADVMSLQNTECTLTSQLYDDLNLYFTDGEILELGMIMAFLSAVAKFIFVFDLVEKEADCPFIANHSS